MRIRAHGGSVRARLQFPKCRPILPAKPQGQRIDEKADERLGLHGIAVGDGGTDHNVSRVA